MTQLADHGTLAIPEPTTAHPPTSLPDCDQALAELRGAAAPWFAERPGDLVPLLERLGESLMAHAKGWVAVACAAKQIPDGSPIAGEEWASISVTARYLRLLASAMRDLASGYPPTAPSPPHSIAGNRIAVPAFPIDRFDKASMAGFAVDVWLKPGVSVEQANDRQAAAWSGGGSAGVSLVLGAGNVAAIPITDALDRLFIARHPVILKMNPVNDYLGPVFEQAFAELVRRGVLRIVYGGADVGQHLVHHAEVDDVHVTGSDKTFEAIVFGGGPDGARRKAAREPAVDKPVTGELGNVSPVIVVPGPWTGKDLNFQAQNIASMLTNNGGFNCIAVRAIVTHRDWDQRDALLGGIRDVLRKAPERYPYYPGARARWQTFVDAHPEAERFGDESPGRVPWTLIPDLRPEADDEIAFTTEAFNAVVAEVGISALDTVAFIRQAVRFANDRLWGTLGASIVVHPKSLEDPAVKQAVDDAIADLRYGTVAVNHWSAINFLMGASPWGAYPGHTIDDVQSGIGWVHNALMICQDDIEKVVVTGPFRMPLKPPWFVTNKAATKINERFAALQAAPSWTRLTRVVTAALRG
jgi:acyl-CoA reductase-like NAD-dependent aldehyde dehydrogenase